jgi:hypothetical protein
MYPIHRNPLRRRNPRAAGQQRGFEAECLVDDVVDVGYALGGVVGPGRGVGDGGVEEGLEFGVDGGVGR